MKRFIYTIIALLFFSPTYSFAATAVVQIDTHGEEINALEGAIVLLSVVQVDWVRTGNSAILFWITEPKVSRDIISFAGITPGGFTGVEPLMTLHGNFSAGDLEHMRFENIVALSNDGTGANVPVSLSVTLALPMKDTESPEDFTPEVASDPNIFDGKYFLVFATQDKGSGIARYEVREGAYGEWRVAESPYVLAHQGLNKKIFVQAIDGTGNSRVVTLSARYPRIWWRWYAFIAILIVIVSGIILKKRWQGFTT